MVPPATYVATNQKQNLQPSPEIVIVPGGFLLMQKLWDVYLSQQEFKGFTCKIALFYDLKSYIHSQEMQFYFQTNLEELYAKKAVICNFISLKPQKIAAAAERSSRN